MSYLAAFMATIAPALAGPDPGNPVGQWARFRFGYNAYTDPQGHLWRRVPFGGNTFQHGQPIANTDMDGLYQEGIFCNNQVFSFEVANGTYRTLCHIADPYDYHPMGLAASESSSPQPSQIPIFTPDVEAGSYTALVKELPQTTVTNGFIYLSIYAASGNGATISGVEFVPV